MWRIKSPDGSGFSWHDATKGRREDGGRTEGGRREDGGKREEFKK